MRKPDQHGIFNIPEGETHWACGFGTCKAKADFIVVNIWHGKKKDTRKDMGACRPCALRWATKDNCESCLRKISK